MAGRDSTPVAPSHSGTAGPFVPDGRRRRIRMPASPIGRGRWRRRRRLLFVTGASGFVGRHLVNGPASEKWEVIAPGSRSLDLRRRDSVLGEIVDWRPDAVIHLAYRRDDRQVIVDGTRNVAEAAAAARSRLVHVSTDLVFPGGPVAFSEHDEPHPLVDYGVDKLDAERLVADIAPGAVIVRTSLVYGTERPSPPQIELSKQLRSPARRTAMSYFTDEYRCPVHAADLAAALVDLATRRDVAGPLHVTGPEVVSRHDLAVRFARHAGLERQAASIRASTIQESGTVRPGRIELDVSKAEQLGIRCRPVSAVLP